MKYPLLAWSEGNCAGKSGLSRRLCPYQDDPMRAAWLKGFDLGIATTIGWRRLQAQGYAYQRLAA